MKSPEIVYEDDALMALNKPAGMVMHRAFERDVGYTLADWIGERYPELSNVGEPFRQAHGKPLRSNVKSQISKVIPRPGIVHRLDRDTSGIILIAKTQEVFLHLKSQFQNRRVEKEYRAIVHGMLAEKEGRIDVSLARARGDFRRVSSGAHSRGEPREAITDYRVVKASALYSYVAAFPRTGRTHQIRAHFKGIGNPIVCDTVYAPKRACIDPPGRLALHAFAISFTHPNGSAMRLEAPLAADIQAAVGALFPDLQK